MCYPFTGWNSVQTWNFYEGCFTELGNFHTSVHRWPSIYVIDFLHFLSHNVFLHFLIIVYVNLFILLYSCQLSEYITVFREVFSFTCVSTSSFRHTLLLNVFLLIPKTSCDVASRFLILLAIFVSFILSSNFFFKYNCYFLNK